MADRRFVVVLDESERVHMLGQVMESDTERGVELVRILRPQLAADMLARFLSRAEGAEAEVERLLTKKGRGRSGS